MGQTCSRQPSGHDGSHTEEILLQMSNGGNFSSALESSAQRFHRSNSNSNSNSNSKRRSPHPTKSSSGQHHRGGMAKWDPPLFALQQQSMELQQAATLPGQHHLLYSKSSHRRRREEGTAVVNTQHEDDQLSGGKGPSSLPTTMTSRLVVRRHVVRTAEEGLSGTHIYAIRWPEELPLQLTTTPRAEQSPLSIQQEQQDASVSSLLDASTAAADITTTTIGKTANKNRDSSSKSTTTALSMDKLFHPSTLAVVPKKQVTDWVTVSDEHKIYVADVGLNQEECNAIVQVTEQVCKGQYAAYTYAKQTLGCREYPPLAHAVHDAVHRITYGILDRLTPHSGNSKVLQLDDREPHMVKYDVTKKERQKLDMHTDKSEWTILISLSSGCGMDFEGGGTYFECLDATLHVQRGHVLIFPGKLRHCGQRITSGLRFLLVGFLVDKSAAANSLTVPSTTTASKPDDDFPNALQLTNVP